MLYNHCIYILFQASFPFINPSIHIHPSIHPSTYQSTHLSIYIYFHKYHFAEFPFGAKCALYGEYDTHQYNIVNILLYRLFLSKRYSIVCWIHYIRISASYEHQYHHHHHYDPSSSTLLLLLASS